MDLPLGLTSALESGNCILFVGAGAGYEMTRPDGSPAPAGNALAEMLAEHFKIQAEGVTDLAVISQIVENRHGRSKLIAYLDRALSDMKPSEHMQWLLSLTWKAVFTTNYDDVIERCYEYNPNPTQKPVPIAANTDLVSWDPRFEVPIFHLHGSLVSTSAKEDVLVTQSDYASFRSRRQMLFDHFRLSFADTPILYFGYRNADPNWQMVTAEVTAQYAPKQPPSSYRIAPETSTLDKELLSAQGLTTLDGKLSDFRSAVETKLGTLRVDPSQLDSLKDHIPSDMHSLFDDSPAAVSRLLNAWDYVNQADFAGMPNTKNFLRGDRPNWPLIASGISFERDLESPLVDRLVDFATDPKPRVTCEAVLGPAGYGTTTLLMAVAGWFAQNRVGRAFALKPGARMTAGDVEFAARSYDGPVVFIVDNAADHADQIVEIVELLKGLKVPAFLLLGERLNEWRQRRSPVRAREHLIEPLSDGEIERLLAALTTHGELGHLADLSPKLQFAAVRTRNQQELLVTMREVTENRAFDAIIEDEFRNIGDPLARDIYALVCAFSRTKSLARDMLCSDALGRSVVDIYQAVRESLEGIVRWETVDAARGIEALRARHQIIADIVWDRCLDRLERERMLMDAVANFNLTYGVDSRAFEAFTRDDDAVDSLQTLEAKTRFFEEACRRDPRNPYVRQHYARMLLRADKIELSLGQIDAAIDMATNVKVLQHTRGVILRAAALAADTVEVGRRRLAQSEEAFRSAIRKNHKDEYSYQSLAELYLDWARHVDNDTESIEYVARAQEVVAEGLPLVRNREGLYVVTAKIEHYLGDKSGRVDALHSALSAAPSSPVVRYLLGNALRINGDTDKACEVLERGLLDHPDDPALAWAFAIAKFTQNGGYGEPLSVLRLARIRGEHQPRFVATFGGMLVMDGQLAEARDVWKRAEDRGFSIEDRNRVSFKLDRPGTSVPALKGRVLKIHPGFAFISVPGMPDFFYRSSRHGGTALRPGMSVEFEPGFSARGPVVVSLRDSSDLDRAGLVTP